jgi:dTDP-3-amino-3,4,6-trideoxy-alpha-D-glucose transaminase
VVPVVDLSRRGERFAEAFSIAADRIARSGTFLLGPELEAFESEWAAWTGAAHAVGVSSGAAALQLALAAVGVGPGDDVVVPAFTAVPTASAVLALGARPVFADVDPDTACITTDTVAAARTPATVAVVVVHLYGYPADLPETDLTIIEDAAQAHGALREPARSAATAYSFYPTKNLGGIGDGGAVVTDDAELAARVRLSRAHGARAHYEHIAVSQNFRMSEVESAWLRICLPSLRADVERRRHIAATYRSAAPHREWQRSHPDHAYHLCVTRSAERDPTRTTLADADVGTAVQYPLSVPQQPAYTQFRTAPTPQADLWARSCISLPCFPEMTDAEIDHVANVLATACP